MEGPPIQVLDGLNGKGTEQEEAKEDHLPSPSSPSSRIFEERLQDGDPRH